MQKIILIIAASTLIALSIIGYFKPNINVSNIILSVTAIIIIWYTYETQKIRKISQEELTKSKRPIIGYELYNNPDRPLETNLILHNHSDYPLTALVKCSFILDGKKLSNKWDAYNGKEFWNLQYKEIKHGHFCWFDLYQYVLYSKEDIESGNEDIKVLKHTNAKDLKKKIFDDLTLLYDFNEPPKLTMDLEIFCMNEFDQTIYYPKTHYELKILKLKWIPIITSKTPYWKSDTEPDWVKRIIKKYINA